LKGNDNKSNPNQNFVLKTILPRKSSELIQLNTEAAMKILKSYGGLRSYNMNSVVFASNSSIPLRINGKPKRGYPAKIKKSTFVKASLDCDILGFWKKKGSKYENLGDPISNCDFTRAVFTGKLTYVMFKDCDFRSADLSKAEMDPKKVHFVRCNFRGCKLPDDPLWRHSLGEHNRDPVDWDKRNLDRVKYDKNAPGMNPDRLEKKRQGKKQKKRTKWQY
jgi:hypothetical protein